MKTVVVLTYVTECKVACVECDIVSMEAFTHYIWIAASCRIRIIFPCILII